MIMLMVMMMMMMMMMIMMMMMVMMMMMMIIWIITTKIIESIKTKINSISKLELTNLEITCSSSNI